MPGLNDDSVVKQELHCHNCNGYVRFELDMALDGNHVLECPECGHEHCRVVKRGRITGDRWDSRNSTYTVAYTTYYTSSISATAGTVYYTSNAYYSTGT